MGAGPEHLDPSDLIQEAHVHIPECLHVHVYRKKSLSHQHMLGGTYLGGSAMPSVTDSFIHQMLMEVF